MQPDVTDKETATLLGKLDRIIKADRYPFSPCIRTLTQSSTNYEERRRDQHPTAAQVLVTPESNGWPEDGSEGSSTNGTSRTATTKRAAKR